MSLDPSDAEANKLAVSQGFTVVHGAMMSAAAWKNAKLTNAIQPVGKVAPRPKVWTGEDDPGAVVFRDWIPESKWTAGMRKIGDFDQEMAGKVLNRQITVKFCATPHYLAVASLKGCLCLRKRRGVTYSRFSTGTDMPSKERLQARPIGRAASTVIGIRSVSFELDSSRSYANFILYKIS